MPKIPNLIIQIIGLISMIIYMLSYHFKTNKGLFRAQFVSYVLYVVHFSLLGAFTGALCYAVSMVRSFCLASKKKILHSYYVCAGLCLAQVVILKYTWAGWVSLIFVIANVATTIGCYSNNPRKIRYTFIFVNSPLCIIYSFIVGSWAGVLDEILSEISMITAILRMKKEELDTNDNNYDDKGN